MSYKGGIDKIRRGLLSQGVTAFVATIITSSSETYRNVIPKIKKVSGDVNGASLLGLHLEGPFISVLGAHPGGLLIYLSYFHPCWVAPCCTLLIVLLCYVLCLRLQVH
jgi:N-acetylglucosamine-6-phosphate deacetylase